MELLHKDGIYILTCDYNQRHWPKGAGFRWHRSPCQVRSCRVCELGYPQKGWWTDKPGVAIRLKEHANGECKEVLQKYVVEISEAVKESRADSADIEVPAPEGLEYRDFQKAGIAYAIKRESTLIADECGLGKTIQALGVVNVEDEKAAEPQKVLIICPASLRLNWEREGTRWLINNQRIRVVEKDLPTDDDWDVLILNYDKFAGKRRAEFAEFCAGRNWAVAILDEAHYLKNPKAQRTEAILATRSRKRGPKGAIGRAQKKLFLTGTPILNRPVDLWPILKTAAPNEFNDYQWFTQRYCGRHFNGYAWDVSGSSNLDELQEKLRSTCMIRRLKKDVLKELPPKIRQIIPIPPAGRLNKLVKKEKAAYEKVEKKIKVMEKKVQDAFDKSSKKSGKHGDEAKLVAYADNQYRQAVSKLRRQMANFEELAEIRHDIAVAKLPIVIEQVENTLAETDKVVVFAHHRDICEAIRDHFGKKAVLLYGGMGDRECDRAVKRFQEDDKIKVFIGSIQAAGVGHTLTASSTVIFAELDWVPANMMQAEDRCIFEGQLVQALNGLRPIETIEVGDVVLTHRRRWKRVSAISSRQHRDLQTEIKYTRYGIPLETTHDHKILVLKDGETEPAWHEAHTLMPRDFLLLPRLDLPEEGLDYVRMPEEVPHDPRQVSNYGGKPYVNGRYKRCPRQVPVDDDLLFVIGWYLAEGFASLKDGKGKFISFSVHDDELPVVEKIKDYFQTKWGLNGTIYNHKKSKGIELRVYSIELAKWFKLWFGGDCYEKRLPDFLMRSLSSAQAEKLCRCYIDGDGYRRSTTKTSTQHEWTSTSCALASQISLLMSAVGEKPCLRVVRGERRREYPSQPEGREHADEWIGSYTEGGNADNERLNYSTEEFVCCPITSVSTSIAKRIGASYRRVHDLTVEDDHSFVVGHAVVHNCHRIGQTDVVNIVYIVVDGSLDAHLAVTLITKQEVIESALDTITEAEKQAALASKDVMEVSDIPEVASDVAVSSPDTADIWGWEEETVPQMETETPVGFSESKVFSAARMKGWPTDLRPERPRRVLKSNAEDQQLAKEAMKVLHDEEKGFNSYDQHLGRLLAESNQYNDKQVDIARGLAQKYRRLLPSRLLERLGIQVVGQRNLF